MNYSKIENPFEPIQIQLNRIEMMLHEIRQHEPIQKKNNRYLTLKETAELFGVSHATIYRNVRLNIFPYRKVGNKLFFSEAKMMEILEGGQHTQPKG